MLNKIQNNMLSKRFFPNLSTLGSYNYLTQTVMLDSLDIDKVMRFKTSFNGQTKGNYSFFQFSQKIHPVITHEMTHWLDSVSTVWGMAFLYKLYKTYNIDDYQEFLKGNTDIDNFGKLLFEIGRHNYFNSYQNTVNNYPWRYQFEFAYSVNQHIIPIVKFLNKDLEEVCRAPISLTSLLESSAMAQEIGISMALVGILDDFDQTFEKKDFVRKQIETLYDPELTEYSVAVHLVANAIHTEDIIEAFRVCAILIRIILNFPTKYFEIISLEGIKNKYHFINTGNCDLYYKTLQEGKDRSLLFFIVSQILGTIQIEQFQQDEIEESIKEAFEMIGISVNQDFINAVDDEISIYQEYLIKFDYMPIEEIAKAGYLNHKSIGVFGKIVYDFHHLITPTIILADNAEIDFFPNSLNKFQLSHAEHLMKAELGLLRYYEFIETVRKNQPAFNQDILRD